MSIYSRYAVEISKLNDGYISPEDYVEDEIKDFVGTKCQIAHEETRLYAYILELNKERKLEYNKKVNEIMDRYYVELYSLYDTYPKELKDIAYGEAYERGHSSGYYEVESIFDDVMDSFIRAFELGRRSVNVF